MTMSNITPRTLRARRERLNLSQSQLAVILDVHANTISRWERGTLSIKSSGAIDLAIGYLELLSNMAPLPSPGVRPAFPISAVRHMIAVAAASQRAPLTLDSEVPDYAAGSDGSTANT